MRIERQIAIETGLNNGKDTGLNKGEETGLNKGEETKLNKGEEIGLEKGEETGLKNFNLELTHAYGDGSIWTNFCCAPILIL